MSRERVLPALLSLVFAGCSTSAFDDRRANSWSDSNGVEDIAGSDFVLGVAGVTTDSLGANIAVLADNPTSLGVLRYDQTGAVAFGEPIAINPGSNARPTIIASPQPTPWAVGLVAVGGLGSLDEIQFFDVSTTPPTFVGAVSGEDCGSPGANLGEKMVFGLVDVTNEIDLVALRGNELFLFTDIDPTQGSVSCARCPLPAASAATLSQVALIEIGFSDGEEILTVSNGVISVFDAFQITEASASDAGCFDIRTPQISNLGSPNGEADFGTSIATVFRDEEFEASDVALSAPSTGSVYVIPGLSDSGPGGRIQTLVAADTTNSFGSSLVFADIDGTDGDELIIGDPAASPEGVSRAGQVSVFAFSEGDEEYELRASLYDSAPEEGQGYGAQVGVTEFVFGEDDVDMLLVATERELFSLFRSLVEAPEPRQP